MNEKLTHLLADLESLKSRLEVEEKEYEELVEKCGGYIDAYDCSGGNFDDAYDMGVEHGEMFGKLEVVNKVIKHLKEALQ